MFDRYYQRRLGADLDTWIRNGWVGAEGAAAIRAHAEAGSGRSRLPSVLGLLGALMIAAGVFAFIAANWDGVPRLGKVAMIFAALAATLATSWALARRGLDRSADSAATLATLVFGGGVALIGQMYHLPADWPAGGLVVACAGLIVAFLARSHGALVVACAAIGAWTFGRLTEDEGTAHLAFWPLFALAAWLAASRPGALSRHAVVLLLAGHLATWLVFLPLRDLAADADWSRASIAIGLAGVFVAAGFVMARLSPAFGLTLAHWSVWAFAGMLSLLHLAAYEIATPRHGGIAAVAMAVLLAGMAAAVAQIAVARDRRMAALLAAALVIGLALAPVLSAIDGGGARALASLLTLAGIVCLIAAGLLAGSPPITAAGYTAFGAAVLLLLHRTVGTLIDQSLFFLAAGLALIAFGWGARRLLGLARATPKGATP
ncbi:MAG: DUF2157 domain-containing protein [Alphaproteobacteria bacterium]|nr:DUF2157 domain-containing protein [Alphaproteobacteria bacterium]